LIKILFLILTCLVSLSLKTQAEQVEWARMRIDVRGEELLCMGVDPIKTNTLYIGTENHLYQSFDNGSNWDVIFTAKGENSSINDILVDNNSILYVVTEKGSYYSQDFGKNWDNLFEETIFRNRRAQALAMSNNKENYFLLTNGDVYKINTDNFSWERIYKGHVHEEALSAFDKEYSDEEQVFSKGLSIDGEDNLYLSTTKGLLISEDNGRNWRRFNEIGLLSYDINFCLTSKIDKNKIFTATRKGVFEYDIANDKWINIYKGLEFGDVKHLCFDSSNENFIYCLTDNGIYRTIKKGKDIEASYALFDSEPTVREVQEMAISYAEVSPNKIKRWRIQAGMKAIFPKISVGLDRDIDQNINIDRGGTNDPDIFIFGPKIEVWNWDFALSWDLGDLIYNVTQTSIDVRSKLMVQLREDILNEVTRIYFERKRLQTEMIYDESGLSRESAEKKLRLQELTAMLDGFTGGEFSESIEKQYAL